MLDTEYLGILLTPKVVTDTPRGECQVYSDARRCNGLITRPRAAESFEAVNVTASF